MRNVVLTSPSADGRSRRALSRALARFPATVEDIAPAERAERLQRCASDDDVAWIVVVDADAVPDPAAFGSLQKVLSTDAAMVGGRAVIGETQRLGSMFGPSHSGPNPFRLVALAGVQTDRQLSDLTRGPVDAPQRGITLIAAEFVRSLGGVVLDPVLLHLDLAVHARAAGRAVLCEPSLSFEIDEDSSELRCRLGDLRRYANAASWAPHELHRDPPRLRSSFIMREVRIMGNYRGFVRRPYPPFDILAVAADEIGQARAQRSAAALGGGGRVIVCAPGGGDVLRQTLAATSDRYLLVAGDAAFPSRALVEALVERLERDPRTALAVDSATAPFGAALFHCGRIVNAAGFRGSSVAEVIAGAIDRLPLRRLCAATLEHEIVPYVPAPAPPATLDVVFVAASKPPVTHQTLQALLGEPVNGTTTTVYPAGATTTERMFAVHIGLKLLPDASDAHLAVGLNRALGACRSESIAIVRDDVQMPHGFLARLQAAFARIPRLGAVVPRVGGGDRPEGLPDQSYRNSAEMQSVFDRRAEAFAREAMLVDVATTPVIMVSREALEVVGGFDETFGFSRLGVEDFTRRLRSANFLVACCEDAYAHLFPFAEAASFVGNLDDAPFLRAAYERRWAGRSGFDPERDRIPLRTGEPPAAAEKDGLRILLPLADEAEWLRARPLLVELTAAFRMHDPLEVAIGLDGTFGLQTALTKIRELLLGSGVPMEETLNISIDFVPDLFAWRDAGNRRNARVTGVERDGLGELPAIDGPAAVRMLVAGVTV